MCKTENKGKSKENVYIKGSGEKNVRKINMKKKIGEKGKEN